MKTEKAIEMYAEMMVKTIENLQSGWTKTWFSAVSKAPRNAEGREYNGMNKILLRMLMACEGWTCPVFVTYNKAKSMGVNVKRGEKAVPVLYWHMVAKTKDGKYVDADEASKDEKVFPVLRCFDVFNVAQTTMTDEQIAEFGNVEVVADTDGMYRCEGVDKLIGGDWYCRISETMSGEACYMPTADAIEIPKRELYTDTDKTRAGQEYYSTAIHEMAHSTGHKSRLDRFGENRKSYGHEELVAELTTAFVCNELGFLSEVQENSAAYLKGWLGNIKSNPKYLVTLVTDVNKAANMILDKINK